MTPQPDKTADPLKCPKCGEQLLSDRCLGSYAEITLRKEDEYLGDWIKVLHVESASSWSSTGRKEPSPRCNAPFRVLIHDQLSER